MQFEVDVEQNEAKEWSNVVLSADGAMVAFHSDDRPNSSIYALPAGGGSPRWNSGRVFRNEGAARPLDLPRQFSI